MERDAKQSAPTAAESAVTIPVRREELSIGTRTVDTGRGVRVRTTVLERAQHIDEVLHSDVVSVEHVPVDKIVSLDAAPASRYEGDTLIVPILEEVLVVERRLRIKEEIHITKTRRAQRHSETVSLKSEEVVVERFDDAPDR
jgi:stress response protein YsnF